MDGADTAGVTSNKNKTISRFVFTEIITHFCRVVRLSILFVFNLLAFQGVRLFTGERKNRLRKRRTLPSSTKASESTTE